MNRSASKLLVCALVLIAVALGVGIRLTARGRGVQRMRAELSLILAECRDKYRAAGTAADSARVDTWVPPTSAGGRTDDPPCGSYRRRNMLTER
jgi:hypothetical protein